MARASINCVLFDLYGTLVDIRLNEDSPALWDGVATAITKSGGVVGHPADVRTCFRQILHEEASWRPEGFLMDAAFGRLLLSCGAAADVAHLGRVFRQLSTEEITVRPYVAPLFETLHRRSCAIGIVSNTEAVLTQLDLDRCPILLSADTIVLSSDVGVRKPDPQIFQIALDRLRAEPAWSLVVGNSMGEDIDGARRAGLRAIYLDEEADGVEPLHGGGDALRVQPSYENLRRALDMLGA